MRRVCQVLKVSERRACRVLEQARSRQRHRALPASDEPRLVTRIIQLAGTYGRYGYRRITVLLRREGWRQEYNQVRPHSALGYRPPAPEASLSFLPRSAPLHPAETAQGLTQGVV